jgi:hypothetical protein
MKEGHLGDDHHLEEGGAMDIRQMIEMIEGDLVIEEVRKRGERWARVLW